MKDQQSRKLGVLWIELRFSRSDRLLSLIPLISRQGDCEISCIRLSNPKARFNEIASLGLAKWGEAVKNECLIRSRALCSKSKTNVALSYYFKIKKTEVRRRQKDEGRWHTDNSLPRPLIPIPPCNSNRDCSLPKGQVWKIQRNMLFRKFAALPAYIFISDAIERQAEFFHFIRLAVVIGRPFVSELLFVWPSSVLRATLARDCN